MKSFRRLVWSLIHYVAALPCSRPTLCFTGLCGNSGVNGPGLKISRGHRTQAEHRSLTDVHPRRDRGAGTDPGIGAQAHGKRDERERRVVVVMRGPANVSLLGNDRVRSHGDRGRVINLRTVAQGCSVGADQIPRSPYPRPGIEMTMRTKPGAEATQQKSTPGSEKAGVMCETKRIQLMDHASLRRRLERGNEGFRYGIRGLGSWIHLSRTG